MPNSTSVRCPFCGKDQSIAPQQVGQTVTCLACRQPFVAGGVAPPATMMGYATPASARSTSGMAITSLVCGCLLCIPIASLLALIFGIIGIRQTSDPRRGGRGMAIAGTALGGVGIMLWVGYLALLTSIMIPSLNRARETANRVKCASNMRQIGQAILLYTNDNAGQYPPDLATLLKTEDLTPIVFVCPSSSDTPATGPGDLESGGHLSYKYIGKGMNNSKSPMTIVMYEDDKDHGGDGMNVLYGDGHVEFLDKSQTKLTLDELKAGYNPPAAPVSAH